MISFLASAALRLPYVPALNKSLLDHYQAALTRRDEQRATKQMAVLERAGINTAATVAAAAFTGVDGAGAGATFAARHAATGSRLASSFVTPPASPGIVTYAAASGGARFQPRDSCDLVPDPCVSYTVPPLKAHGQDGVEPGV